MTKIASINQQRAQSPPNSELSPYYYKGFWGYHKGYVQGMVRGAVLGMVLGAAMGVMVYTLLPVIVGLAASLSVVAAFAGGGAIFGANVMGRIGGSAGNIAAVHAMEELKVRYPNSDLHELGFGHHYERSATKKHGKWFLWDVGVPGGLLGATVGGLIGYGGLTSYVVGALKLSPSVVAASPVVIPAVVVGILGLSYGINREKIKTLFNWTDDLVKGDLKDLSPMEKGRIEKMKRVLDPKSPDTLDSMRGGITPRQYQSEYQRLYREYFDAAFASSMGGNSRGLVGGYISGILVGAAMGTLLSLIPGVGALGILLGATFGGGYAVKKFTHAGAEAGGHAGAIELWEKKEERLIEQAINSPSLRQYVNRENQIKEHEESIANKNSKFINWRMLVIGTVCGAIIGLAIVPVASHFILAAIGSHATGFANLISSVSLCGLIGSSFGIGSKVMRRLSRLGDKVYNGMKSEELAPSPDVPAIAPDSRLHILSRHHHTDKERDSHSHSHGHTHTHTTSHDRGEPRQLPKYIRAITELGPAQQPYVHAVQNLGR